MIVAYYLNHSGISSKTIDNTCIDVLSQAVWVDLLNPTPDEESLVERTLSITIPTKKDVEEIEPSSRLYVDSDVLFMTATMVVMSDQPEVKTDVATFILKKKCLITLRYNEMHAFKLFAATLLRSKVKTLDARTLFIDLLDAAIDRLADILEKISNQLDTISKDIFRQNGHSSHPNFKGILQRIGTNGDLGSKANESLISFTRLISYLEQIHIPMISKDMIASLLILQKDISALREHASFLSTKVSFLLDATMGMINIQQNNIIKIFSVAAVIFLPPTLIASIYGMNFNHMPELDWAVGYPVAIGLMLLSAWLPYRYFKKKKWL